MRKIVLFLYFVSFIWADGTDAKKPYEATWLEIEKTDNGYVILNYPTFWDCGKTRSLWTYRVKGDNITLIVPFDEEPAVYKNFDEIVKLSDSSYWFNSKAFNTTSFKFDYVDKANHIAKWSMYYSSGKLRGASIFIDSLHNTFPMSDVEYVIDEGGESMLYNCEDD